MGKDEADNPLLVVTTVGSRDDALVLARALVELRLAACAQIGEIDSVYRWQGAVHEEPEFRILFKTRADRYAQVEAAIRERHPYDLPAIHAIATRHAEAAYAAWVADNAG
jgi:periplasmic divalent cation tolerance protein